MSLKLSIFALLLSLSVIARGDTITFYDTTDTITVGQVGAQHTVELHYAIQHSR